MTPKKILVVDDNPVIHKTMGMTLTASGYDVITAEDGSTAVSAARNERPDLILLDISFPPDVGSGGGVAWAGFVIMSWLRRLDDSKDIPIIVISGGEPAEFKNRALAAGAVCYFHKSVDNDELLAAIRDALANNTGKTPPPTAPTPHSPSP
jgi:two-component system KDP operon response regulator KdpE